VNNSDLSFSETFAGFEVFYISRCLSTQDLVKELPNITGLRKHALCVYTFEQTSGRGQRENLWLSEPGKNLAVSIHLPISKAYKANSVMLNKSISLAVCHAIQEFQPEAFIKWPNDIRINTRKVAGILIESNSANEVTIGIGINVNQKEFLHIEQAATSLMLESGKELIITKVLHALLTNLQKVNKDVPSANIHAEYDALLEGKDKNWVVQMGAEQISAVLLGVDEAGRIRLQDATFKEMALHHGEARLKWVAE
jgi:BirA family biotin operon repressor/biotin-[acetyl-CoA-carboxylase] ligase